MVHRAASILTAVQILPVAFERHGGLKIFLFRAQKVHFRQHGSSTTNSRFLHDLDNGDKVDLHVIENYSGKFATIRMHTNDLQSYR